MSSIVHGMIKSRAFMDKVNIHRPEFLESWLSYYIIAFQDTGKSECTLELKSNRDSIGSSHHLACEG